MEVTSTASRQGRVVLSRYMDTTASSRAAAAGVSAGRKPTAIAQEKTSKNPTQLQRTIKSNAVESTYLSKKLAPPAALAPKHQIVAPNISGSRARKGKSSQSSLQTTLGDKATTGFELEIASQLYPWIFMRHTLAESSNLAIGKFQEKFAARINDLEVEEKVQEESRICYCTQRETRLLDELSLQHLRDVMPTLVQTFIISQDRCQVAIVNATGLQGTDWETVCVVQSNMRDLDRLTGESEKLRESTAALLCTLPPDSLLASTLEGLLSVLDMRLENLALSRKLLAIIRDNGKKLQHLESLRVLVEDSESDGNVTPT